MGQILHGCATTTEAVRRAIQHSQESLRASRQAIRINQKTAAKWKARQNVVDRPTGQEARGLNVRAHVHGASHLHGGWLIVPDPYRLSESCPKRRPTGISIPSIGSTDAFGRHSL